MAYSLVVILIPSLRYEAIRSKWKGIRKVLLFFCVSGTQQPATEEEPDHTCRTVIFWGITSDPLISSHVLTYPMDPRIRPPDRELGRKERERDWKWLIWGWRKLNLRLSSRLRHSTWETAVEPNSMFFDGDEAEVVETLRKKPKKEASHLCGNRPHSWHHNNTTNSSFWLLPRRFVLHKPTAFLNLNFEGRTSQIVSLNPNKTILNPNHS